MIAFGPVPSRRLGMSLGINNIPPKICTYSCVYCQVGNTLKMSMQRQAFYSPEEIYNEVSRRVREVQSKGTEIDYLSFVPDGEPTLDINIGKEIQLLKKIGIKIAVITNASLLWMEEVRADISGADWVCVKVDAVTEDIFKKVDRPYGKLSLKKIKEGIKKFSDEYKGELVSETMLVKGINDSEEELKRIAGFLSKLHLAHSYIMIPIRPPAEEWADAPSENVLNMAYIIFKEHELNPELLTGVEKGSFGFSGDVEEDLLATSAVHPMRRESVEELLRKAGKRWDVVEKLIKEGWLKEVKYRGKIFYMRALNKFNR